MTQLSRLSVLHRLSRIFLGRFHPPITTINPPTKALTLLFFLLCATLPGTAASVPEITIEGDKTAYDAFAADLVNTLQTGNALLAAGKYEQALTAFRQGPSDDAAFALGIGLASWKAGRFAEAVPYLRAARPVFQQHVGLQKALHEIDLLLIEQLEQQRRDTFDQQRRKFLALQVAPLYEETLQYGKAARRHLEALPAQPTTEQQLQIAELFYQAKSYTTAAEHFLAAAKTSSQPHVPQLRAVDCYLLCKRWQLAEDLLKHLKSVHPDPEHDWEWARLYRGQRQHDLADRTLIMLGGYYMKQAKAASHRQRRPLLLKAAQAYLDGNNADKGLAILDRLAARETTRQPDIDQLRGDYFFRSQQYQRAIDIYARHPDSVVMQVAHGYAHFNQGQPFQAHQHFKDLQLRFPLHPEVLAGWRNMAYYRPWIASYIYTHADYGKFQDARRLHTTSLTHHWGRFSGTLAYTRTDGKGSPVMPNFREDLFGARLYRKVGDTSGLQFHLLHPQNNDTITDNGMVVGGRYISFPRGKFHWDTEMNAVMYPDVTSWQTGLGLTYRHNEHWSTTLGIDAALLSGDDAHTAATKTPLGMRFAIVFQDHNAVVTLAGWAGERILRVDSAALHIENTLDSQREGASLTILQKGPSLDLYLKLAAVQATSHIIAERNERVTPWTDPEYKESKAAVGANFRFF